MQGSWALEKLGEVLDLAALPDAGSELVEEAVERIAEAVSAQVAVLVRDGGVVVSVGLDSESVPVESILGWCDSTENEINVPGVGTMPMLSVNIGNDHSWLVLARCGAAFDADECAIAAAGAGAIRLMDRLRQVRESERAARQFAETRASESSRLAGELQQRDELIQRFYSSLRLVTERAPIAVVLHGIIESLAATVIADDEAIVVRLRDESESDAFILVAGHGTEDEREFPVKESARTTLGDGPFERGDVVARTLSHGDERSRLLAVPLFHDHELVGYLGLVSSDPDRTFEYATRQGLVAFAENIMLALADARLGEALDAALEDAGQDPLTGLKNRASLLRHLTATLRRSAATKMPAAVLFLDLDRFKLVNDTLGHAFGDVVLCEVSRRLRSVVRDQDIVARLSGDEFVIICEDGNTTAGRALAERVLAVMAEPVRHDGCEHTIAGSVGLFITLGDETPEEVLANADMAMYRAKERGRGGVEVFDWTMRRKLVQRRETGQALRQAVSDAGLHVAYQPIVRLGDRGIVGVEALARWSVPVGEEIGPDVFVPLAEEIGIIRDLDWLIVNDACRAFAASRLSEFSLSVNLSARHFADRGLVRAMQHVLQEANMEPSRLWVEVTESMMIQETRATFDVLRGLRDIGVRVALDDFGTGYSSLRYLQDLPVDRLKIDRSFISGLKDGGTAPIVTAIASLSRALELELVAEGIETEEQAVWLTAQGCTHGQGYLFGRPGELAQIASRSAA